MSNKKYIDADFVRVRRRPNERKIAFNLYFGDEVIINSVDGEWTEITAPERANTRGQAISGFVKGAFPLREEPILKASMVDVQQGDGMVIETPSGKILLIDGGDNKLFARHLAARFRARQTTEDAPLPVEAILITHGDADHFSGLSDIKRSETLGGSRRHKRIFIQPKRILHNGLVKGPGRLPDTEQLGSTVEDAEGHLYVTALYEDIRQSPEADRNSKFKTWINTINHWNEREAVAMERLALDKDISQAVSFLSDEDIEIELHSPEVEEVTTADGHTVKGLKFHKSPPKTALLHEIELEDGGSYSAGHTINGHSIAFRLKIWQCPLSVYRRSE